MSTTVKVSRETLVDLIRIKGLLENERGESLNKDEVIRELIKCWKAKQ